MYYSGLINTQLLSALSEYETQSELQSDFIQVHMCMYCTWIWLASKCSKLYVQRDKLADKQTQN